MILLVCCIFPFGRSAADHLISGFHARYGTDCVYSPAHQTNTLLSLYRELGRSFRNRLCKASITLIEIANPARKVLNPCYRSAFHENERKLAFVHIPDANCGALLLRYPDCGADMVSRRIRIEDKQRIPLKIVCDSGYVNLVGIRAKFSFDTTCNTSSDALVCSSVAT